eukprot:364540-Chlamydomonas_euryale.AAC.3
MAAVEAWAKPHVSLTYRSVGSGAGGREFANGGLNVSGNDFGSGDIPLSSTLWADVRASGNSAVQIPYLMNPGGYAESVGVAVLGLERWVGGVASNVFYQAGWMDGCGKVPRDVLVKCASP